MFTLHPQLEQDTFFIADWDLCRVLLMNNAFFPWLALVPRVADVREIMDLAQQEQHRLMDEITRASRLLQERYKPDKINVAALGNQVPQLHVHVIARFTSDSAWPQPVWGKGGEAYQDADAVTQRIRSGL